ncbi:hypothetical protein RB653_001572 [Dictyostelium firmibasis]|uniref:Uncharacterized protein n=1 Tax=Dictyostelium firmibasis TaxID=79012 RepID=A0AAN7TYR7_9MYCE
MLFKSLQSIKGVQSNSKKDFISSNLITYQNDIDINYVSNVFNTYGWLDILAKSIRAKGKAHI